MEVKDIHRGQIYKANLGCRHGPAENNNMSVLIIQNDVGNYYSQTTIVVPVEEMGRAKCETQYEFTTQGTMYCAHVEQIRVIDKLRLLKYVGTAEDKDVKEITKRINIVTNSEEGELFWADLGETVGSEQWGVRPVLVIQSKKSSELSQSTIVVPITSRKKLRLPTHHRFYAFHRQQTACAEQIRALDKNKLRGPIGALAPWDRDAIKRCCEVAVGEFGGKKGEPLSKVVGSQ